MTDREYTIAMIVLLFIIGIFLLIVTIGIFEGIMAGA